MISSHTIGSSTAAAKHYLDVSKRFGAPLATEKVIISASEQGVDLLEAKSRIQHNDEGYMQRNTKSDTEILYLNIGGTSYRLLNQTILQYGSHTFLGTFTILNHANRLKCCNWYFEDTKEYFFERVPKYFDTIYDFYATGKLHIPKEMCFEKYMDELKFWRIPRASISDCCSPFHSLYSCPTKGYDQMEKDLFIGLYCSGIRRKLWEVLEGNTMSRRWRIYEIISTSFIVLSVSTLVFGSIPDFQVPELSMNIQPTSPDTYPTYPNSNGQTLSSTTVHKITAETSIEMVEHPVFIYTENFCVIYFLAEYLLRFLIAPRKLMFVKDILNVIDLIAVFPLIFEFFLFLIGISGSNVRKFRWAFLTVRIVRILRVVRIVKLGRFSSGLANFALTLKRSKSQMQMVAIVMVTAIITFSAILYFLEKDEPNTTFTSIPAAFWWAVVTMSTVGYGDSVPQTIAGKMFGSTAIVVGVMVLALPITILVNNFMIVVKLREEQIIRKYMEETMDNE